MGDAPFVLQDFPLVTNVVIPTKVILQVVEDCPTCVMLKHEDWPGLEKISALRKASDTGARRISILCGNGGLYLLEEMLRGADGAMTGFAYPEMMAQVIAAYTAGEQTMRAISLTPICQWCAMRRSRGWGLRSENTRWHSAGSLPMTLCANPAAC